MSVGLGSVGLLGPDEPRHAEVAREMLETGEWVTPHLMGYPWLDKPPLYHWAAALSMKLLGPTETAARLPSAAAALATCFFIAGAGARLFGPRAGLSAGLVLASSLGMAVYGRAAIVDSVFTLTLTLGLGSYALYATHRRSTLRLALSFGFLGAAVLAKGPVGLMVPLIIIGAFHVLHGRSWLPKPAPAAVAAISLLVVAAPWYIAVLRDQGWEFVEVFFFHHNLDRFFTTVHRHPGPFYYYLPILIAALFPWSVLLPISLTRACIRGDPRRHFLALWVGIPLVFFSLAGSKLPGYLIPVLPPCALLIGLAWAEAAPKDAAIARSLIWQPALSALLGAATVYVFATRFPGIVVAGWVLAFLNLGAGAATFFCSRKSLSAAFWSLVTGSVILIMTLVFFVAPLLEPYQSLRTLASSAASRLDEGERVICYKTFYRKAVFYTRGRLGEIWTLKELRMRAREWGRILILTERWRFEELAHDPSLLVKSLQQCGNRVLAEVRPSS